MANQNRKSDELEGGNFGFLAGNFEDAMYDVYVDKTSKVRDFWMGDFTNNFVEISHKMEEKRRQQRKDDPKTTFLNEIMDVKDLKLISETIINIGHGLDSIAEAVVTGYYPLQMIGSVTNFVSESFIELARSFTDEEANRLHMVASSIGGFGVIVDSLYETTKKIADVKPMMKITESVIKGLSGLVRALSAANNNLEGFDDERLKSIANSSVIMASSIGVLGLSIWAFTQLVDPEDILMPVMAISLLAGTGMLLTRFGGDGKNNAATQIGILSASIGVLGLSIWAFNELVDEDDMLFKPILAISALGLAAVLLSKAQGKKLSSSSIVIAAASIGVLGLSIWAFNELVDEDDMLFKPILAIGGLALTLYLLGKRGKGVLQGSLALVIGALSLYVLSDAISTFDDVKYESMLKSGLSIAGLTLALSVTGKTGVNVLFGAAALLVGAASVGVLAYTVKKYDEITYDALTKAGLAVGGLTIALAATGASGAQVLLGAGALLVGSFTVGVLANSVKKFEDVSWEGIGKAGAAVGGLGLALSGVGLVAPLALLGGGALLLGSASTLVLANALKKTKGLTDKDIDTMKMAITGVGFSLAKIGNPFTVAFTVAGAGALGLAADGVNTFSKGLSRFKKFKLTPKDAINASSMSDIFITGMVNTFDKNKDKMDAAGDGIVDLMGLGNLLVSMSKGIQQMANLTFVEQAVQNGKIVPVSVQPLTEAHFVAVGQNIAKIINAVSEPLAKVGQNASFFTSQTPVGIGIKNLTGLGNLMKGMAGGVQQMANLTFTEFAVENGKLVPKNVTKLTDAHFTSVGQNIAKIIESTREPIISAGKGGSFFSSKSAIGLGLQNLKGMGNVIGSLGKGVSEMANLRFSEYDVVDGQLKLVRTRSLGAGDFAKVGQNIGLIINSLKKPLEKIGQMDVNVAEDGVEIGNMFSKFLIKTGKGLTTFNKAFATTPFETFKPTFSGYIDLTIAALTKIEDAYGDDVEGGMDIVSKFTKSVSNVKDFGKGLSTASKASIGLAKNTAKFTKSVNEMDYKTLVELTKFTANLAQLKTMKDVVNTFAQAINNLASSVSKAASSSGGFGDVVTSSKIIEKEKSVIETLKEGKKGKLKIDEKGSLTNKLFLDGVQILHQDNIDQLRVLESIAKNTRSTNNILREGVKSKESRYKKK